jgi:hypothetical protein
LSLAHRGVEPYFHCVDSSRDAVLVRFRVDEQHEGGGAG